MRWVLSDGDHRPHHGGRLLELLRGDRQDLAHRRDHGILQGLAAGAGAEDPFVRAHVDVLPAAQGGECAAAQQRNLRIASYASFFFISPTASLFPPSSVSVSVSVLLVQLFFVLMERVGTTFENTMLGSAAAACACSVMIPVDTVKTRLVTQRPGTEQYYDGMIDCFTKVRLAVLLSIPCFELHPSYCKPPAIPPPQLMRSPRGACVCRFCARKESAASTSRCRRGCSR